MLNDNSILLNKYLEENSRRSQLADRAVQARANATNLQKAAESFDPLLDQEPPQPAIEDSTSSNSGRLAEQNDHDSSLVNSSLTIDYNNNRSKVRSVKSISPPRMHRLTSNTGTAAATATAAVVAKVKVKKKRRSRPLKY